MTKPKKREATAAEAVRGCIAREKESRGASLKPIEIVKVGIAGYQTYMNAVEPPKKDATSPLAISADRTGLRRGTWAAVDRMLFNVNYWLAAYEDRIVAAVDDEDVAQSCLKAITAWNDHTMKLNTLSDGEVAATFERFCPPFAVNKRRGKTQGAGKGPVVAFANCVRGLQEQEAEGAVALAEIAADVEEEAALYEAIGQQGALDAFFDLLPAWCLQGKIGLVAGSWWDDCDVVNEIARQLAEAFAERGYGEATCRYFLDTCMEAIDSYQQYVSTDSDTWNDMSMPHLIEAVRSARTTSPGYEVDGYADPLPAWLASKEQLIWNIVVCAIYGPTQARPMLYDALEIDGEDGGKMRTDVITELAQESFDRYAVDVLVSEDDRYDSFGDQPIDLRNSGIEQVSSIPDKMKVLGYRIVPTASCYPDQRIVELRGSEVECLAILEHRRWVEERLKAGWSLAPTKNVAAKQNPYLLDWDDLPERARECNRRFVRSIPSLLAGAGLSISK